MYIITKEIVAKALTKLLVRRLVPMHARCETTANAKIKSAKPNGSVILTCWLTGVGVIALTLIGKSAVVGKNIC